MLKLEDIKPRASTFTLEAFPRVVFHLRAVSVEDEIWMQQEFGKEIEDVFTGMKMDGVCRIAFRLLDAPSREHFKKQSVKMIDEKGEETTEELGGYKLLERCTTGFQAKTDMFAALLQTIGISRPQIEDVTGQKKKLRKSIGRKSSTRSVQSTGGQRRKSYR